MRARHDPRSVERFDVICAGEALWKVGSPVQLGSASRRVRLRPGGGAADAALALAGRGLRVALATVLSDDALGRACKERIAASGVDVGAVTPSRPRSGFVLFDASGGANQVPADVEEQPPLEVPEGWSSEVLLLSGLSPVVSHAAALCKTARAARRRGTLVLLDFDARLHAWAGRDPRTIRMVLREVDVVRCSVADLAVIGLDAATVRGWLRPSAVLVVSDGAGGAIATGPFGDVAFSPEGRTLMRRSETLLADLCVELARPGRIGESPGARWYRMLEGGPARSAIS